MSTGTEAYTEQSDVIHEWIALEDINVCTEYSVYIYVHMHIREVSEPSAGKLFANSKNIPISPLASSVHFWVQVAKQRMHTYALPTSENLCKRAYRKWSDLSCMMSTCCGLT